MTTAHVIYILIGGAALFAAFLVVMASMLSSRLSEDEALECED